MPDFDDMAAAAKRSACGDEHFRPATRLRHGWPGADRSMSRDCHHHFAIRLMREASEKWRGIRRMKAAPCALAHGA